VLQIILETKFAKKCGFFLYWCESFYAIWIISWCFYAVASWTSMSVFLLNAYRYNQWRNFL